MRKTLLLVAAASLVISCSNGGNDAESIRKQIASLREQSITIDNQINELEKQLETVAGEKTEAGMIPIKVKQLKPEAFDSYIEFSATVEAVKDAKVSAETPGIIRTIYVERGQQVRKGQAIASLSSETIEK